MQLQIEDLKEKFQKIKDRGWVEGTGKGFNSIGVTFEQLLGIDQNELEIADYDGIEIKTKRYGSKSYITLFSYTPEGNYYHEVERIKDTYGYPHKKYSEYKVLNNSVYGNKKNKIGLKFYFKLLVDRFSKKIYLEIYDKENIIERNVYWDFDILEKKVYRKLEILALIKAYSKKIDNKEYFKYNEIKIYKLKNFDKFITLVEKGLIRVNFRLNINTSENKFGKIHDHGTSFDILEENLKELYERI